MTGCEKNYASLAKSLLNDIVTSPYPLSERAVDILDALRTEANNRHPRHPMIISMLESTDLTKVLTKTVHVCKRQMRRTRNSKSFDEFGEWDKAMQSAEVLLSFFKEATDDQLGGKKESVSYDDNAASEVLNSEIKPRQTRQTVCTEVELATERLQSVDTSLEFSDNRGDDRNFVSPTPTRSLLLGDNGKCTDSSPDDKSTDVMVSAECAPRKDGNESISCDTEDDCVEESNDQCSIIDDDHILTTTIKATIYNEDTLPESRYKVTQRVYAKDDSTGLLYPAFVRKVMWGPKVDSTKLIVNDQSVGENDDDEDDDEDEDIRRWSPKYNTFHYYVHFYGWAVTWDRWVHQEYLYEDSEFTLSLSKLLTSEYKKVQPKKGQRMSLIQMATWMKRIVELEAELKMTENETGENDEGKCNIATENVNAEESKTEVECATVKFVQDNKTMNYTSATVKKVTEDDNCRIRVQVKVCTSEPCDNLASDMDSIMEVVVDEPALPITTAILQKQAQLYESGIKIKHKKHLSDQLTLPFNLKKILVEEWEVITQCNMLHNLPCATSVRKALNVYLESKLEPLRNERANESIADDDGDKVGCTKVKTTDDDVGKEWIDMVEGIALFFDQALPIHLLFTEERGQYDSLCRQIRTQRRNFAVAAKAASMTLEGSSTAIALSSDGDGKSPSHSIILPERMSEIYGCEHLVRLFLRLPGVIAESPTMTGMEARRVFAKLGDLVRFLQKNQSLFESSFRKPLAGEMRHGCSNGGGGKRKRRSKK